MSTTNTPTSAPTNEPAAIIPKIRPLPCGGVDVRLGIGADELASLPRCVYEVSRDYLSGDFTDGGRDSLSMIILVLSDLIPDDHAMIHAINEAGKFDPQ